MTCCSLTAVTSNTGYAYPVLGKLLGKCSELSYQLLYIKLSFTTPKLIAFFLYLLLVKNHKNNNSEWCKLFKCFSVPSFPHLLPPLCNVTVFVYYLSLSFCLGINSSLSSSSSAIFPSSNVTHSSSPVCVPLQQRHCRRQPKHWFVMSYRSASVGSTYTAVYSGGFTDWSFYFRPQQKALLRWASGMFDSENSDATTTLLRNVVKVVIPLLVVKLLPNTAHT